MTSISSTSASSSVWSTMRSDRAAKMFAKADTDGSGSVDKTELQTVLDKIADKTGGTAASADDVFAKMDTDGSGSLDASELDAGMKSLMPAPSSTVDFAQKHEGGHGKMHGGKPPGLDDDSSTGTSSSDSSITSLMQDIFKAADANNDGTLSTSETDDLKTKIESAITAMTQSSEASTSAVSTASNASNASGSSDSSSSSSSQDSAGLAALLDKVLKEYGAGMAGSASAQQGYGSLITASA